ncbi:PLP-dependent aminotransferase family protein, partial [Micromonospora aurantiaca]
GLHLMVTLPGDVDDRALAAAALRRGVKVHPLSWHSRRPQPPGLVLGYAATPPSEIDRALSTVADAVTPPP